MESVNCWKYTTILSRGSKIFDNTGDDCTIQGCDAKFNFSIGYVCAIQHHDNWCVNLTWTTSCWGMCEPYGHTGYVLVCKRLAQMRQTCSGDLISIKVLKD